MIIFEDLLYTYDDLDRISQERACRLQKMGIKPKDRVAIQFPNCPDFIFWYFAITRLGAIVVPLHASLTREEVQTLLQDCAPSLFITENTLIPSSDKTEIPPYPHKDTDILAILYTSGTTGIPKGATLTSGNIRFVVDSIRKFCQTTEHDSLLLSVPISHAFGQNLVMHHAIQAKATLVITKSFMPHLIKEKQVSMLFATPTMYRLILQTSPTKEQFESVRYCHSGAAPLDQPLFNAWLDRFGIPIHQGYGLTECSPLVSYNDSPLAHPTSIGKPIDQVQIQLLDDQGQEATVGEIVIQGPNVMKGYWNRFEQTNKLYSGDIGTRDAQGNLYLIDRKKDLINVSGMKVYPSEVEEVIAQHPAIQEAAVLGVKDPIIGEKVKALIVLKKNHQVTQGELIQFCRKKLALFKIPETFLQVESLPRNPTGKILRRRLDEYFV